MTINATLLVQMVHFLVAYVLFDRLLLRRALAIIVRKEDQEKASQDRVDQAALQKEALLVERHAQLVSHKKRFSKLCPPLKHDQELQVAPLQKVVYRPDQVAITRLRTDVLQALTKACSVVRS